MSQTAGQPSKSDGAAISAALGIQNSGIVGGCELKGGAKGSELTVSVTLKETSLRAFGVVGTVVQTMLSTRKPQGGNVLGLAAPAQITKAQNKLRAAVDKNNKGKGAGIKVDLTWTRGASGPWKFALTGSLMKGTQSFGDSKQAGFHFESGVEQALIAYSE